MESLDRPAVQRVRKDGRPQDPSVPHSVAAQLVPNGDLKRRIPIGEIREIARVPHGENDGRARRERQDTG